jgi:Lipocalin-like domain
MRNSVNILAAIAGLAMIVVSVPSQAQSQMTKDELVGTWQIVSFKATSGSQVSYPLGEHPNGYWGFSPTRFWVLLTSSARKTPAAAAFTDAEAVALMKSHAAYSGKYDVDPAQTPDGIKISIHVDASSSQALTGTERVFFMRVDDHKLTARSPSLLIPMSGLTLTGILQLEFEKAD